MSMTLAMSLNRSMTNMEIMKLLSNKEDMITQRTQGQVEPQALQETQRGRIDLNQGITRVIEETLQLTVELTEIIEMGMDQIEIIVEKEEEQDLTEHITMATGNEGSARRL